MPARCNALALAGLLVACGCETVDVVARAVGAAAPDGGDASAGDGAIPDAGDGGSAELCGQSGPLVRVGDNPPGTCGGALALRQALCACTGFAAGAELHTDAWNSAEPGNFVAGGSVGVNGEIGSAGVLLDIGGALVVSSPFGVMLSPGGELRVGGALAVAGPLQGADAATSSGADARVNGRIVLRDLSVAGTLTVPAEFTIDVSGQQQLGELTRAPVSVEAPCGCGASELVDIASLVAARAGDNDNARAGLASDALSDVQSPLSLELGCGRYYLERVFAEGDLELRIRGRVALYLDGHVDLGEGARAVLEPGAELDVYIAGNLLSRGDLLLGTPPDNVRLYVGGAGTVDLRGTTRVAGAVYAPRAELVTNGPTELYGSLFVRRAAPSASLTVHYDRNPQETGGCL